MLNTEWLHCVKHWLCTTHLRLIRLLRARGDGRSRITADNSRRSRCRTCQNRLRHFQRTQLSASSPHIYFRFQNSNFLCARMRVECFEQYLRICAISLMNSVRCACVRVCVLLVVVNFLHRMYLNFIYVHLWFSWYVRTNIFSSSQLGSSCLRRARCFILPIRLIWCVLCVLCNAAHFCGLYLHNF